MKKHLLMIMTALSLALCLGGCAGQSAGAPAVQLGFIAPLSGDEAAVAAQNAFQLAIDEANDSGEFPYTIEAVYADDAADAATAYREAQLLLLQPQLAAVVSFSGEDAALATLPLFNEAATPLLLGAVSGARYEYAVQGLPLVMQLQPPLGTENAPLAELAIDQLGYTEWFVISDISEQGEANLQRFSDELAARELAALGVEQVQTDIMDLRHIAEEIEESNAAAVYCGCNAAVAAQLANELAAVGVADIFFCGPSSLYYDSFTKAAASEQALSVTAENYPENAGWLQDFYKSYAAAGYTEPAGWQAAAAYDAAQVLIEALRSAGELPDASAMAAAVAAVQGAGLQGTISFDAAGYTQALSWSAYQVTDGAWQPYQAAK
ncbi:MAG: ABC transporter substrate-binding protein [Bacillota bacterium]|nr:ABC transporter substrate-binding protein [Bacillota bacterium]